jgi:hypothetical protein
VSDLVLVLLGAVAGLAFGYGAAEAKWRNRLARMFLALAEAVQRTGGEPTHADWQRAFTAHVIPGLRDLMD